MRSATPVMEKAMPPSVARSGRGPVRLATYSVTTGCTACTANCASSSTTNSGSSPGERDRMAKLRAGDSAPLRAFGGWWFSCTRRSAHAPQSRHTAEVNRKGARKLPVTSAMAPPTSGPTSVPTSCPVLSQPSA